MMQKSVIGTKTTFNPYTFNPQQDSVRQEIPPHSIGNMGDFEAFQEKMVDFSIGNSPKERNRIAAKKWRSKKDAELRSLEAANDQLRTEALSLLGEMNGLRSQGKVLESELAFFQRYLSKIVIQKNPN